MGGEGPGRAGREGCGFQRQEGESGSFFIFIFLLFSFFCLFYFFMIFFCVCCCCLLYREVIAVIPLIETDRT